MSAARSYEETVALASTLRSLPMPARSVPAEELAYVAERATVLETTDAATRQRALLACRRLAMRLSRMAAHEGLAAAWRGTAREHHYQWLVSL